MNRLALTLTVALLSVSLATVGCNDKCKQELAAMQQQYNALQLRYQDAQNNLAESETERGRVMTQLQGKDGQLAAANMEIVDLKKQLGAKPAPKEGWQETATGARITLASDILFAAGKATLSQSGSARLRQVAAAIKTSYPGARVRVYGFTDNDPIKKSAKFWKDNLDLSANRSMAVTRELRRLGIPAKTIETIAMGATHFISANTTAAGKAKNRRVEIVVLKQ